MLIKYAKPYPTIGKIIAAKDFDYVAYREYDEKGTLPPATGNNTDGKFFGCFKVTNGKIISLDGDSYDDSEPVIAAEEWTNPDKGIEKGLTVVVAMEYLNSSKKNGFLNKEETTNKEEHE